MDIAIIVIASVLLALLAAFGLRSLWEGWKGVALVDRENIKPTAGLAFRAWKMSIEKVITEMRTNPSMIDMLALGKSSNPALSALEMLLHVRTSFHPTSEGQPAKLHIAWVVDDQLSFDIELTAHEAEIFTRPERFGLRSFAPA